MIKNEIKVGMYVAVSVSLDDNAHDIGGGGEVLEILNRNEYSYDVRIYGLNRTTEIFLFEEITKEITKKDDPEYWL